VARNPADRIIELGKQKEEIKKGEQMMREYSQSLAIWRAMVSIMASIRERGAPVQANQSQQEEA